MKKRESIVMVGDFETTVYKGQEDTEVWASAVVELYSEDVKIFHSIDDTFDYLTSLNKNIIIYYHNLKFDGQFWMYYLLCKRGMKQAFYKQNPEDELSLKSIEPKDMLNNTFNYSISYLGSWYSITMKVNGKIIEIRDSLKLLPFSVERIGESFKTKHKKLDMEYIGFRFAGCEITEEEKHYIANDVLVIKEALEIMYDEGHKELTIGSCCLKEFKERYDHKEYKQLFPNIYEIDIDKSLYGSETAGEYVRKAYKGGWCYLVRGKECKIYKNGTTADVNSLYPSMMSSESGNYYPVRKPIFWKGNYIPKNATVDNHYYFIRIKTRFYIKENKLPCIQIKNNYLYRPREWLDCSDILDSRDNTYKKHYKDIHGNIHDTRVIMTLTMTDFKLICEHYYLEDFEILDGCWFYTEKGLFDNYINKYRKIKMESKGAIRELAKLFLNNLYGKMATSLTSSFKYAFKRDDGSVGYYEIEEYEKKPGYIPIGCAITSYARNFTIRAAQANYHGINERGFIYADTDSIHCDLEPNDIKNITVDSAKFCCWKLESCWDEGYFTRQKTYIEHIIKANLENVEDPYYSIKCAGMPERCKDLFLMSVFGYNDDEYEKLTKEEKEFVKEKRTINDFKVGLKIPGKLMPKHIRGGVLLVDTTYEMR